MSHWEFLIGGAVTVIAAMIGALASTFQASKAKQSAEQVASLTHQREVQSMLDGAYKRVRESLEREHEILVYTRELIDHIYQQKPPPPPTPPKGLSQK